MADKKRVLITGASGFIGGFLVTEALNRGYDVWAGIRQSSSREQLKDERIRFIDLQYDDKTALIQQLREVVSQSGAWHYVVHNAGVTKTLHAADFFKVNAQYTEILIEALAQAGCIPDKFLLMSSLSSFGPVAEKSFRPIRMDDAQQPNSIYGKSKLQAERIVKSQNYFPYVILCPTGVYGPGEKDYLMEIKSIQSGFDFKIGMTPQRITFIYVKDLAMATFLALENPAVRDASYFVTDGDAYTDNEFVDIVKKLIDKRFVFQLRIPSFLCYVVCCLSELTGKLLNKATTLNRDKFKILKQRNWACEVEQTFRALDFIPQYHLKEGLEEILNYNQKK